MYNILEKFKIVKVIGITKSKEGFIVHAEVPGKVRMLKFSIEPNGSIFGLSRGQWLELNKSTQQIIREKFRIYCTSFSQ